MNQVLLKAAKDIAVKRKRIYYKGVVVEALVAGAAAAGCDDVPDPDTCECSESSELAGGRAAETGQRTRLYAPARRTPDAVQSTVI